MEEREMSGAEQIAAERKRQIEKEHWHSGHDDAHDWNELAWAAVCYAAPEPVYKLIRPMDNPYGRDDFHDPWPWEDEDDKRKKHDQKRRLVIAGALIAAEIDRLERLEAEGLSLAAPVERLEIDP